MKFLTYLVGGVLRRICWVLFKLFPIKTNKIVFVSYYGEKYADSPRAITEYILNNNENFECIWAITKNNGTVFPKQVKTVRLYSLKYVYHMSTAKFWVDNCRKLHCSKRKGQNYIQTWHGGFGLKKVEQDVIDKLEPLYIRMATEDAAMVDLMLSNSRKLTDLYHSSFWYPDGEVLEKGLPRNDFLINHSRDDVQQIKKNLNLPVDSKICLYAPTFRADKSLNAYDIEYQSLVETLTQTFGGNWFILIRLHPNIAELASDIVFDEHIVNVSDVNDIMDLFVISDILISDYSSCMFDFILTKNPVIIYASDIDAYKNDRSFYVPLESLPFPIAKNNDELKSVISDLHNNNFEAVYNSFNDEFSVFETGNAAAETVKWMKNKK